ncbi:MAG: hypothetical protein KGY45_04565 [Hadesarchaea archaeon]|nr:hypothetical protein [Hadesarchaea archaeon]
MSDWILYITAGLIAGSLVFLEWDRLSKMNWKRAIIVLIIIVFLASALLPLFTS